MTVKMFDEKFAKQTGLDKIQPRNTGDRAVCEHIRNNDPFVSFGARVRFNQPK